MIKKGDIIDLNIESLSYGGLGIAHYNDIVVFVKGALPGQSVKSKIFRKKKKYLEAYVLEIIKESTDYVEPLCEHFGTCGGCLLQNYNYKKQLDEKQNQIKDLFSRIAKVETPQIKSIIGCEDQYYYRNKMEFSYSPNRWVVDLESIENEESNDALGLHVKGRFDKIIDINDCHLHGEKSNTIFKFLKEYLIKNKISSFDIKKRTGYLKNIIIRQGYQTDEILINFITTSSDDAILSKLIESLTKKFKSIKSIINTVVKNNSGSSIGEEKILWGENYINDNIGKYTFKISSNSFFQTNTKQSELLYKEIKNICDLKGDEIVYDLYCGTGSIGIYIAEYVKMVYGVEIVMDAVIDAIENAQKNNIKNIQFFHGNLIDFFQKNQELQLIDKPDLVIVDPPRSGIHQNTLDSIVNFNPKKILYVSCNPSTQARDISILGDSNYIIKDVQPIDMFPHTPHIENITLLIKDDK